MKPTDTLSAMGDTSDAVARTLLDKGIRGRQQAATVCPVANYLTSCGFHGVRVGMTFVRVQVEDVVKPEDFTQPFDASTVGALEYVDQDHTLRFLLPQPVRDFIRRFDDGAFPEMSDGAGYEPT